MLRLSVVVVCLLSLVKVAFRLVKNFSSATPQGEDVVSGRFTAEDDRSFRQSLPGVAVEIERIARLLEAEFGDMQDFEFTVERGRLYLLQTRSGYRSPLAAVRIAVDLVEEGLINPAAALARLSGIDIAHVERRQLVVPAGVDPIAHAIPAAAGAAVGCLLRRGRGGACLRSPRSGNSRAP